ncbi:MAG: radical SAM protein, partial [Terrimicrobiaceae bacterium]|nr:radical SAM protein [Terrimicrobiaceae bacterium]
MNTPDWSLHPAVIVWEMTRACRLACRHCRAESRSARDPRELVGAEMEALLDQVEEARPQLLILTGGDPSRREDLLEAVAGARARGLRVAFSPSATPDLLDLDFGKLRELGVCRVSLSLDGATAAAHNSFRGVARAWAWTMEAAAKLRRAGLGLQINSTVTASTIAQFDDLAAVVESLAPAGWTLFLVVPTGRAGMNELPAAEDVERLFEKLVEMSRRVSFEIRTTEGPHYRRLLAQRGEAPPPAVNDGKGFVFVSHVGEVCPSGFLPVSGGNVRTRPLLEIYREAPLFQRLREPSLLQGRCGRCPFKAVCGGSRARAFATTGNY